MTTPTPVENRLAAIERQLAALATECSAIRAELRSGIDGAANLAPAVTHAPPPASPTPRHNRVSVTAPTSASTLFSAQDVERFLGRYGMLALSVLALVAAVGTFLSWAIAHRYLVLRPPARVAAGLLFGLGLGVWGLRLRVKERSFGSSVVGLALVVVLVCAYAAGPSFHLVPTGVAFVGAAFVSWALVLFALGENDEPLWCVGFGGATLAPFVTSSGRGNVYALAAYSTMLLLAGCFAIGRRIWPVAWRTFYVVSAWLIIAGAAAATSRGTTAFLTAFAVPFVVAAGGVLPFAPPSIKRGVLRWFAILAIVASLAVGAPDTPGQSWALTTAFLAAVGVWLVWIDRNADVPQSSILERNAGRATMLDWLDAALLPLLFSMRAAQRSAPVIDVSVVYAGLSLAFGLFAWRRVVSATRDAAAFGAAVLAIAAVSNVPLTTPSARIAAFVALALAILTMHGLRPTLSWLGLGLGLLLLTASLSAAMLLSRVSVRLRAVPHGSVGNGAHRDDWLRHRRALLASAARRNARRAARSTRVDLRERRAITDFRRDSRAMDLDVHLGAHRAVDGVQSEHVDAAARHLLRSDRGGVRGGRPRTT